MTTTTDALVQHIADWEDSDGSINGGVPSDVLVLTNADITVKVGSWRDGYSLWWTDHVANDWVEWFPTLPLAVARLAVLLKASVSEEGFAHSAEQFIVHGSEFLSVSTT